MPTHRPPHRAFLFALFAIATASLLPGQYPPGGYELDTTYMDKPFIFSDKVVTKIDVRHPKAPAKPPAGGWPVILCSHGRNGTRKGVLSYAVSLAKRGYLTIAMDIRPYGRTAKLPNNPKTMDRSYDRIMLDWVEILHKMEAKYGTLLDDEVLGLAGTSMGGYISSYVSAHSGKPLPLTSTWSGVSKTGPTIKAATIRISAIDTGAFYVTEKGDLLSSEFARVLSEDTSSIPWNLAKTGNYALLRQRVESLPTYFISKLLRANPTVPIQAQGGWDDYIPPLRVLSDVLASLSVPRMGLFSIPGHGSPGNQVDRDWNLDMMGLWCDRHVKGIANGIDQRPRYEVSVTPHNATVYKNEALPVGHRFANAWPPKSPMQRLYLRGNNTLTAVAPSGVEASQAIVHKLPTGYNLDSYVAESGGKDASKVTIARSTVEFVGPTLTAPTELFGRPRITATVSINRPHYQLSASLWSRDANNKDRYVSAGTVGKNVALIGTRKVDFDLMDVAMVVPKGNRLVVKLHNLALFQPPGQNRITWVPDLRGDVTTTVKISNVAPATLHLPIAARRGVDFTPRFVEASAAKGFTLPMRIAAGVHRAGRPYAVGFGLSGITPPMTFLGEQVWLRPDALTSLFYLTGSLNATGQALQTLALPPTSSAAGLRVVMVALVVEGASVVPSLPIELDIGK